IPYFDSKAKWRDIMMTEHTTLIDVNLTIPLEAATKATTDPLDRIVAEEEIQNLLNLQIKAKIFIDQIEDADEAMLMRNMSRPSSLSRDLSENMRTSFITMGCGFLDNPDIRITWARLGVKLFMAHSQDKINILSAYPHKV